MTIELIPIAAASIVLLDEGTRRRWEVSLSPYAIAPHPVTRAQYRTVVGEAPPSAAGVDTPVTDVSWLDAIAFCNRLSEQAGLAPCYVRGDDPEGRDVEVEPTAPGYRLPTEAEWEHACRAGSSEVRYGSLDDIAWHRGNSGGAIHDVGTRAPNAWGLFDTLGNAWEWCWDVFDPQVYGAYRVFRGGGWFDPPRGCRASCRRKSHPTFRIDDLGFRLARSR